MMRAIVVVLALLAGAKLYAQERFYREGAQDALIRAYQAKAIAGCRSQHGSRNDASSPWERPISVDVVLGRASANVWIWQFNNTLWSARYKHPHVVLTAIDGDGAAICEYDVIEGRAFVMPM
jgi:hypothetical protein